MKSAGKAQIMQSLPVIGTGLHILPGLKNSDKMRTALKTAFAGAIAALLCLSAAAQPHKTAMPSPDGTYMFAERDTCKLYMDIYEPAKGTTKFVTGREKPTVIFMFGGGFVGGRRNDESYMPMFNAMSREGLRIVSIDYRLGLKGQKNVGLGSVDAIDNAIHIAVEDLFSATNFIIDNAKELGIDPENIVIMGSSAGAISVLQAEYELCNDSSWAQVLPEDFNYKGVISLAGAILSRNGGLKYARTPCPMVLFHGTADKVVNYKQTKFFKIGWYGSNTIASVCRKMGYNHCIYRFEGARHEIADAGLENIPAIMEFLEVNVSDSIPRCIDATVTDPRIETSTLTLSELYN